MSDPAPAERDNAGDRSGPSEPRTALGRLLRHLELGLLAALFLALVVLGLVQIGLRNLADSALPWADPAMRAGVLWLAMLSAVLAAGEARHIRIDLLGRLLPDSFRNVFDRVLYLLTALFCVGMAYWSADVLKIEMSFGDMAFLSVPRWVVLSIIPIGFALMAWRFVRHAVFGTGQREDRTVAAHEADR